MPFLASLPPDAGPPSVFARYPELYRPWAEMSQVLMNGPSPFSEGERELILAYAAGVAGCRFVAVAHAEVAYAWGISRGLIEQLLDDPETDELEPRLRPVLAYVRKLTVASATLEQCDADAVIEAGWSEDALHDAILLAARAAFMQRLVEGLGFAPIEREVAARHARRRVERGYVALYSAFRAER